MFDGDSAHFHGDGKFIRRRRGTGSKVTDLDHSSFRCCRWRRWWMYAAYGVLCGSKQTPSADYVSVPSLPPPNFDQYSNCVRM